MSIYQQTHQHYYLNTNTQSVYKHHSLLPTRPFKKLVFALTLPASLFRIMCAFGE